MSSKKETNNRTILLIEDNEDHAEITRFYVNEYAADIKVVWLNDGKAAMDHILEINENREQSYPWLILLDIKLPKYNGHEVLSRLKSNQTLREIPVVMFTTSTSNQDIDAALKGGANSYIQKPIEPDGYAFTIAKIIDYWSLNQHGIIVDNLNKHA